MPQPQNPNPTGPQGEQNPPATDPNTPPAGSEQQEDQRLNSVPDEWKWLADEARDARSEAARRRVKVRELEERLQNAKTVEEFEELRNELTSSNSTLELTLAKERAARKHGLTDELLEFLDGSTAEQIEERAGKLASLNPGSKPKPPVTKVPLSGGTTPSGGDEPFNAAEEWAKYKRSR